MAKRKLWAREELIVVFNLYCSMPFGQMHSRNQLVIKMAGLLGRTPGSVAMKLVNFASFDPIHQARGISGLKGASYADREIWNEFHANWEQLAFESEQLLKNLSSFTPESGATISKSTRRENIFKMPISSPSGPTESLKAVRIRTVQNFFRKIILAAYQGRCCITGNPIPEFLIASHILPWSKFPEHRINPNNGLCLAVHFDKAFDSGLITFDEDLRLVFSSAFYEYLPNDALSREFLPMKGMLLRLPEKFHPDKKFFEYHREHIFR
jgi:putative restriction endonuclease